MLYKAISTFNMSKCSDTRAISFYPPQDYLIEETNKKVREERGGGNLARKLCGNFT